MKARIYLWDNLKVILMMMVVMTHSINIYQIEGDIWVQYLWVFIMTYSMPLFMMVSGFWYKPREINYSLKTYLYPCLLFSVINIMGGVICGAYPNGVHFKTGWAMWYLWALFVYSVITPYLKERVTTKTLLIISFAVTFLCEFKFFSNNFIDIQRVVNFYPFYIIGIYLREEKQNYIYNASSSQKKIWLRAFVLLIFFYTFMTYIFPGICYQTGFMSSHGLSLFGIFSRWYTYAINTTLALSFIMIIPNKKLWFSDYGTRTMNVYLLHMSIVFPLSWYALFPVRHEWYGYILYILVVPSICTLLFSLPVDKFMKRLLTIFD